MATPDGYERGFHNIYSLKYHLVFVTKWRKPAITAEVGEGLKLRAEEVLEKNGGKLISAEPDRDHMHLLVSLPPTVELTKIVRSLKTELSKCAHEYYPEIVGKYLYGDAPFWSPSYFAATTGSVSMETVKAYIESQTTEEHQRKYQYTGKYRRKGKKKSPRAAVRP